MSDVITFITSGFRRSYERAAKGILDLPADLLLIPLPLDLDPYISCYLKGLATLDELMGAYAMLTGLHEPHVNALRFRLEPLLAAMRHMSAKTEQVHGYQDLGAHTEAARLHEELLRLELRAKITSKFDAGEWRKILGRELELCRKAAEANFENIEELLGTAKTAAIVYGGYTRPLRSELKALGHYVRFVFTDKYWRPPLEALMAKLHVRGLPNVTDDEIGHHVRAHLEYLDYVMASPDIDAAYDAWLRNRIGWLHERAQRA